MAISRTGVRVALLASAALLAAACGGGSGGGGGSTGASSNAVTLPKSDPTATVQFMGPWPDQTMNPIIERFSKAHPTITVKYNYVPFEHMNSTLESRMSAKSGTPDVYAADMPRVPAEASRGYTADLTDAFGKYTKGFYPSTTEATTYHGKLEALPMQNSTQYLFYNKDLLDKAGIKPPGKAPSDRLTWEQVTKLGRKAQHAGAKWGLEFVQVNLYYQLESLPVSLGGTPGATGTENLTPDVNSAAWVKAFTWYHNLFKDGITPRGIKPNQQTSDVFVHGKIAFFVSTPFLFGELAQQHKFDWGYAPYPYFKGGKAVTPTGSWSLAINPFSKHKGAAAMFLKWMTIDNNGSWVKYSVDPALPAHKGALHSFFKRKEFQSPQAKGVEQLTEYELKHTAVNRVRTVGYLEFEDITGRAFSDISNGTPSRKALQKAQSQLKSAWQKYK